MPRVAIRRTRASKTRGKSYLWGQREAKEAGIYCDAPRARTGAPGPFRAGTTVESMGFGQIKRVVFFIYSGIPRNPHSDEEYGRLSGRLLGSTNCPLYVLFLFPPDDATQGRKAEEGNAMIFIPSLRECSRGRRPCSVASSIPKNSLSLFSSRFLP